MNLETEQFLWINCPNPKHDDQNPSCCVNKVEHNGNPMGFYYCYSCGWHGNMEPEKVRAMSKKKAVAREKKIIDWNKLNDEYIYARDYWEDITDIPHKPFDVSYETFNQYGLGWNEGASTFPMRNEYGEIIGIHRRFPDGQKCCVEGSQLGLFLPPYTTHVMGVAEGISDACVALECGLPTIALPSASFGHEMAATYLKENGVQSVVLIGDKGKPGEKSVEKMKNLLDLSKEICYNTIQFKRYKDLRKYYEKNGKKKTTELLIGD